MLPNGPGVDEHRGVLQRLEEVGLEGVPQDHGHGPGAPQLLGGHRATPDVEADHDLARAAGAGRAATSARARIGHDLGGGGDVEPRLAGHPVLGRPEAEDDVAQRPVVDVEHPPPRDGVEVELEVVAVVQVVVDDGRQGVVGGGHGVDVAGQVEVERLERGRPGCSRRRPRRP